MSTKRIDKIKGHLNIISTLVVIATLVISARLFWIQIIQGDKMTEMSYRQIIRDRISRAPRGTIFDKNGKELALSVIAASVTANPKQIHIGQATETVDAEQKSKIAKDLAEILHMKPQEIYEAISTDSHFAWIKRLLTEEERLATKKYLDDNRIGGFYFQEESKRFYPQEKLAAQVLGFVGTEDKGLEGLELKLDSMLRSSKMEQKIEATMSGMPILASVFKEYKTPKMISVQLTIDSNIQFVVEKALDSALKRTKVSSATVIVMDPKTGAILGMTSRPNFDPNNYDHASSYENWKNRAISIVYEPGSTFKPIVMAAAINENIIKSSDVFNDTGAYQVDDRVIRNWDNEGNGKVNYEYVLKNSLNTGMVDIGLRLGKDKMNQYARMFGLGKETGVDLPGEEKGILYNDADMLKVNLATMSIGQGIAVTPLQILRGICVFANGGYMVEPYVIDKINLANGEAKDFAQHNKPVQIIKTETADEIKRIMELVINEGGGKLAKIEGYRIAGKTGTAEKLNESGTGYESGSYIASFVGFAPVDNPKYAVIVVLDSPKGVFYGSAVAAPVFREIMEQILVSGNIVPVSANFSFPETTKMVVGNETKQYIQPDGTVMVPTLQGLTSREAAQLLAENNLVLKPNGSGRIMKQSQSPGTIVNAKTVIEVWLQ